MFNAEAFARPFKGFAFIECAYGSIWLGFLVFPLWYLLASDAPAATKTAGASITLAFALIYSFGFGAIGYFPRGWTARHRFWVFFGLLSGLAVGAVPVFGASAVSFVTFLVAVVAFVHPGPRLLWLIPVICALGCGVLLLYGGAWEFLSLTVFSPVLVVVVSWVTQAERKRNDLQAALDLANQREKIASDVHDLLGHSLTVMKLKAEVAARYLDRDPDVARKEMQAVAEIAKRGLAEVRVSVAQQLGLDLPTEIDLARDALASAGVRCDVAVHAPEEKKLAQAFAWIVREAATNVIRHAQAERCTIEVTPRSLRISDDGQGVHGPEGHGIEGIRRRATEAGARLSIEARPKGGTLVEVQA
ncbi:sensor histidine kinase [Corynebacterium gerontici]|uniref:Sensor histidine kinase DesK n=1 Tax=Corynebacterium gerontici TaxID=2079234 RepID=A0A3G6J3D7_9CORY|nr:histidine kinase [Corynebacterium gerontici]AZA10920.1 Sensor histidine kinase DesK [Corynebacterium gerontici]